MGGKMKEYKADYYRMTGAHFHGFYGLIQRLLHHNLAYMYWFRKYQESPSILKRVMLYRITKRYGLEISPKARVGAGLYLGHPYNITVGEDVIIGQNVNLHKGCTIGRTNRGNSGSPRIGNQVYIGINATIVGNIVIGDDVLIAPNSYVNFDVPSHSIVVGNPGVIHTKENATRDYINFCI